MDFHSMVSSFKKRVLEEGKEELEELSEPSRARVAKYIKDGTPGRHTPRYSFNHIFGDQDTMRLIIPLDAGIQRQGTELFKRVVDKGWEPAFGSKIVKIKKTRLGDEGGGEYETAMKVPVLTMKKDEVRTIPKGPRAGEKITRSTTSSLGKLVSRYGTPEDKEWWAKYQTRVQSDDIAENNVAEYFLIPYKNNFKGIGAQRPIIVISRHPIDVARMSDFTLTHSCHSEGSGHFECAIAESKGHGMVAYLIKPDDVEVVTKRIEEEDEIFGDSDIGLPGPEPVARVRLRKFFNQKTGDEFATVENRVYGANIPDFLPTVRKWARDTQEDMWKGKDGNLKPDFVNTDDWVVMGGDYFDTEYNMQLQYLFAGTKWEGEADNMFGFETFEHSDVFSESSQEEMEEATERAEQVLRETNARAKHGSFHLRIEEGWEGDPWHPYANYRVTFEFPIPTEKAKEFEKWAGSEAERMLRAQIKGVLENYYFSYYENWDFSFDEEDHPNLKTDTMLIDVHGDFESGGATGFEALAGAEYWMEQISEEYEEKYDSIKYNLRAVLVDNDILPPGAYETAVGELDDLQYENLKLLYDENDPGDGIDVILSPKADFRLNTKDGKYYKIIDVVPPFSEDGLNVSQKFQETINYPVNNSYLRRNFKRQLRKAEMEAEKQIELPFGDKFKRQPAEWAPRAVHPRPLSKAGLPLRFGVKLVALVPEQFRDLVNKKLLDPRYELTPEQRKQYSQSYISVGYRIVLKIDVDIEEMDYERIKSFLGYLDKNLESFEDAVKETAANAYKEAADIVKSEKETRAALDKAAASGGVKATLGDPVQLEEAKIREAIRKALRRTILKEQTGFETRLFQINLKIQVDRDAGGGIEQKLNRIRAIEGVTVVGHDELKSQLGRQVIEARVKFHPESDALRPGTYINQILVPEINSSKLVPGVKVIEIVKGSLKRLDK